MNLINCLHCQKETSNPRFCSRNCAASFNNKTVKLKHGNYIENKRCGLCNEVKPINSNGKFCASCRSNLHKMYFFRNFLTKTIRDVAILESRFRETTEVRRNARELWQRLNYPQACEVCGYDKHYEICHIRPIKAFSLETKLKLVNNPANLVALCPNCHWEFDNNKMDEESLNILQAVSDNRKKRYLMDRLKLNSL